MNVPDKLPDSSNLERKSNPLALRVAQKGGRKWEIKQDTRGDKAKNILQQHTPGDTKQEESKNIVLGINESEPGTGLAKILERSFPDIAFKNQILSKLIESQDPIPSRLGYDQKNNDAKESVANINHKDAETLLRQSPNDSFMIRQDQKEENSIIISMKIDGEIRHTTWTKARYKRNDQNVYQMVVTEANLKSEGLTLTEKETEKLHSIGLKLGEIVLFYQNGGLGNKPSTFMDRSTVDESRLQEIEKTSNTEYDKPDAVLSKVNKDDAEKLLLKEASGSFLFRPSSRPGYITMSYNDNGKIGHIPMEIHQNDPTLVPLFTTVDADPKNKLLVTPIKLSVYIKLIEESAVKFYDGKQKLIIK